MATVTAAPGPPHNHVPPVPAYQEAQGGLPSLDESTHDSSHQHKSNQSTQNVPRGTVQATMNFFKPPEDGSPPHNFVEKPTDGTPQRNFGDEDHVLNINDMRGHESDFDLDHQAFAGLKGYPHNTSIDWNSDDSVKTLYYPEVERILLENVPGSPNRVLIFDHTIRRADPAATRAPVNRCHIDQTPKSAEMRVEHHLPDEAPELLKGRYRIINVWRPINGPVESQPLGFADSTSVPDSDMVAVQHRYPNRTGETAAVRYNPDHKWYYWSGIGDDERIMLQCFDSSQPSTRVPHSAFIDPRNNESSKPRESIEVRALVFG